MALPIFLGQQKFEAPSETMTGAELRRLFRVPADDLLFHAQGSKVEGEAIEDTTEVHLKAGEHFISVPRNITGGALDVSALPEAQRSEVELIEEAYPGTRLVSADGGAAIVVPISNDRWSPDPVAVLVRIPSLYPQQPPDLIFLESGAHPRDGTAVPRRMQETPINGVPWQQVSWHFGGPYEITRRNLLGFVHSIQRYLGNPSP